MDSHRAMATPSERPVIHLIEPNERDCAEVAEIISEFDAVCHTFVTAEKFLASYSKNCPGCVFTELQVGRYSSLRLPRELRLRGSELPVILLTSKATVPIAVQAFKSGLFDLIEKPVNPFDLWDRATQAFEHHEYQQAKALERQQCEERLRSLTLEERQVMEMILDGHANKAIASALGLSVRTIVFRRNSLMRKLQVKTTLQIGQLKQHVTPSQRSALGFPHLGALDRNVTESARQFASAPGGEER